MSETSGKLSREERLAAKLRENLHRRKHQARALASSDPASDSLTGDAGPDTLPK